MKSEPTERVPFDPDDAATWPALLLVAEVAAINRCSVDTVLRKCLVHQFQPAPIGGGGRGNRYRWRRAEVERAAFGVVNGTIYEAQRGQSRIRPARS